MMPETRRVKSNEFPQHIGEDSAGPTINLLLVFLLGWTRDRRADLRGVLGDKDIIPDSVYGKVAGKVVLYYQFSYRLRTTGICNPETLSHMKDKLGFDLESVARSSANGDSIFVQPNGDRLIWNPKG